MILRTYLSSFSIVIISVIASPCLRRRDAPLDLLSSDGSGTTPSDDELLTVAYASSTDEDILSSDHSDADPSIFFGTTDGSGSAAAVDGFIHTTDSENPINFALEGGGSQDASSGILFPGLTSNGASGGDNLMAQLPDFGGITDFSFKNAENEKSCPVDDGTPATEVEPETPSELTDQTTMYSDISPEDRRRCPQVNGMQPVALCCFSPYKGDPGSVQYHCQRRK